LGVVLKVPLFGCVAKETVRFGTAAGYATRTLSKSGRGLFPLPTCPRPSRETKAALIICHPELAKDLTTRQPASCHPSPFSKLTAPHDEPSVPISCRLNRTSGSPREISSTDSGQALRRLPTNLPVGDRRSAPTAQLHTSLGQRPTAIKLRNSRSRSQAPAWERPCLGGSSLPFLSGALCFWRPGRRLEPPEILHSQAGAWERARVTRASKLNLMAVGRRPRTFANEASQAVGLAQCVERDLLRAFSPRPLWLSGLGRCPRLHCGRAVGAERLSPTGRLFASPG